LIGAPTAPPPPRCAIRPDADRRVAPDAPARGGAAPDRRAPGATPLSRVRPGRRRMARVAPARASERPPAPGRHPGARPGAHPRALRRLRAHPRALGGSWTALHVAGLRRRRHQPPHGALLRGHRVHSTWGKGGHLYFVLTCPRPRLA